MGGVLDSVWDASSPQPLERGGEGLLSSELKWGILEPQTKDATSALHGLIVGKTLVDLHQSTAVVRLNLSGQRRKLKKGT